MCELRILKRRGLNNKNQTHRFPKPGTRHIHTQEHTLKNKMMKSSNSTLNQGVLGVHAPHSGHLRLPQQLVSVYFQF